MIVTLDAASAHRLLLEGAFGYDCETGCATRFGRAAILPPHPRAAGPVLVTGGDRRTRTLCCAELGSRGYAAWVVVHRSADRRVPSPAVTTAPPGGARVRS